MIQYSNSVTNNISVAVEGASVTVLDQNGVKATIYSDGSGTVTQNPLTTDVNGLFTFWADAGTYDIEIQKSGLSGRTLDNVVLGYNIEDLADTTDIALGDALVGGKRTDTGAVSFTLHAYNENRMANVITDFGAAGNGTADDESKFTAADVAGKLTYIPKPSVSYNFGTTYQATSGAFLPDPTISWSNLTDSGNFDFTRGFLSGSGNGSNIWRLADRVFVGEAATNFAGTSLPDAGNSWLDSSTDGPAYLLANAQFLSMASERRYAIVGATSTSLTAGAGSAVSIGSAIINDGVSPNDCTGWGLVIEGQHETTTKTTYGIEIALKNASGQSVSQTPYTIGTGATYGISLVGGGDNAFGPAATHACTSGIVFTTNNTKGWNSGIEFRSGSITGSEPEAISLANGFSIKWYENITPAVSAVLKSTNNTANERLSLIFQNGGLNLTNNSDKSVFFVATSGTDVNRIQLTSGGTGVPPQITAAGDDTNIDLRLNPKGTGAIRFGTHSAIGAETVTGYITIKDAGGTSRKIAVVS